LLKEPRGDQLTTSMIRFIVAVILLAVMPLRAQIVNDGATNTLSNVTNSIIADVTVGTNGEAPPQVRPNRTLPKVKPPKTELEFSATPTTGDISRARVFEVRLAPIGGEPDAAENAALASALLGYAKRSGPDDFASL